MRYGVALVTVVVGLAAIGLVFLPLALRHRAAQRLPPIWDGTTSVYAVPLAGGEPRRVLRLHGQWEFPVASPDGKALLLERPLLTRTGLWRVPLDGGAPVHLRDLRVFAPRSEHGGFAAAEAQTHPSSGWRIDLFVRDAHGHLAWRRQMPFPAAAVSAAPDGRSVAAVRMHRLELVTPARIRLLAADAEQSWPPLWTRDGRALLYWTNGEQLVVRDLATGAGRVLLHGRYFENALSADGRTVYVLGRNDAVSIPK